VILVTGAGGNVGSALVEELVRAGQKARLGFHSEDRAQRSRAAGHDAVAIDFGRPETLGPAMAGVEAVFLLGATGPNQVAGETNVVDAAKTAGAGRIVKLSVWRAPEELTPFARAHRSIERSVEDSGLDWTFLRPNFYMQNFTRQWAGSIRDHGWFAQPTTAAAISFIDVRDIAAAAARVLVEPGHENRAYAITGPAALSYVDAAAVLSAALGSEVLFRGLTDEQARAGMLERGIPQFHVDYLLAVSQAYRNGGAEAVTTAVQDLTGRPATSFDTFVRDHLDAFR
jgi:uncharacterized protein YbjT (DUF2867 family)